MLFVKVENDGFNLGAQRRAVTGSGLPDAKLRLLEFFASWDAFVNCAMAHKVPRAKIGESGEWNLTGDRYVELVDQTTDYPMVKLDELYVIERGGSPRPIQDYITEAPNGINWIKIGDAALGSKYITQTKEKIRPEGAKKSRFVKPGDFILSNSMSFGRPYIMAIDGCIHDGWLLLRKKDSRILDDYLYSILGSAPVYAQFARAATGGVVNNLNSGLVRDVSIPLPPLAIQQEIVAEIEGYQKIIDGARQVVENYRPRIVVQPDWPVVELGNVAAFVSGGTPSKANEAYWTGSVPWVSAKDMKADVLQDASMHVSEAAVAETATKLAPSGSLLILVRGMGLANGIPICELARPCAFNQDVKAILPSDAVDSTYLRLILKQSENQLRKILETAAHGTLKINSEDLRQVQFPLPPLETQRAIIAEIDAEQTLVNANKHLIERFEAKVNATINQVWNEGIPVADKSEDKQ